MKWKLAGAGAPWPLIALSFIAWALLAVATRGIAAPLPVYVDRFDRDSGLSQLTVNAIAQDATGFLWVGTEDGFDRFDGYTFSHVPHEDGAAGGLSNHFVAHIARDARGALWLATDGGGVLRQDPLTGTFEPLAVRARHATDGGFARVRTLHFDRSGQLWIGTRDAGLARFNPQDRSITRFRHDAADASTLISDSLFSLLEDERGTLWIGTDSGLDALDAGSKSLRHQKLPVPRTALVRALLEDGAGSLWVGTTAGLVKLEGADHKPTFFTHDAADPRSLPANTVNALLEDSTGRLWVGTTGGLALFDRERARFDVYRHDTADARSLPDDDIFSLFEDRTGLLWIGTKFGGLAKWNPRTWSFGRRAANQEEGFASRNVMAFTEDRAGRTWVATFDGGITILDPRTARTRTLRHDAALPGSLSEDRVMALLTDHDGVVWAGTMSSGLNRFDPKTLNATVFRHRAADPRSLAAPGVMSLLEDSAHRLWVGTYGGGLSQFDRATQSFHQYPAVAADLTKLSSGRVTALVEDRMGLLWVGTDGGGLNALDMATGRFERFRHDPHNTDSLSADTVYSLHVDARGTLWIGTRGGGLDRLVGSGYEPHNVRFEHLTEKNGLANDTIYGIRSDATGQLWVSTNYGLARIDIDRHAVHSFHRAQGLQGEEFNFGAHYMSSTGTLFFGGTNGYNAFSPTGLQFNATPPPIVLTSLTILNKPTALGALARAPKSALQLPWRDDVVTFEFAALDFSAPLANTFQYRLEGADQGWLNAGNRRTVTYAKLPAGSYSLRVRAANADGAWNSRGLAIPLTIEPPPWKSNWAYAVYLALAALLIAALWRVQRRRLEREAAYSKRLEVQVRERTRELAKHANALEHANLRLEEASYTDPLTGLGNRRSIRHTAPQMIAGLPPGGRLALMMIDLDSLKPINDDYGHDAGDRVLNAMGCILRDTIRGSDSVVRWGGDEFVIVHSCSDLEGAAALAERIRHTVANHRFVIANKLPVRTSCSIGFALHPFVRAVPDLLGWEDVLRIADGALYRAKSRRNAWVGWSGRRAVPDLSERILADPDAAQIDNLIKVHSSDVASGETIEMLLQRPRGRAAAPEADASLKRTFSSHE